MFRVSGGKLKCHFGIELIGRPYWPAATLARPRARGPASPADAAVDALPLSNSELPGISFIRVNPRG
jgi:hypothetical protein